jgi:cytosine/uracil/thiamine/allantoin permease
MKDPGNRFWATVAAQTAGVLVLFFIAIMFDVGKKCDSILEPGLQMIFIISFLVFLGLVLGFVRAFLPAQKCGFNDSCVDRALNTFLAVDIFFLTLLVCLEGGLTRSMFSPLFVLIPIAHSAVESDDKTPKIIKVLGLVVACTLVTLVVSILVSKGMQNLFGLSFLQIVDFSAKEPTRFAFSLFFVTLISFFIFILSKEIIKMPPQAPPGSGIPTNPQID